jgi:hydrogenase maturation protease
LECWNIGEEQSLKDKEAQIIPIVVWVCHCSIIPELKDLVFGFPVVPSFQCSIIPVLNRFMSRIAVIGLGNILLGDEGLGVHGLNLLKRRYRFSPEIETVDGGTLGLELLPFFQDYGRILILDAVDFGREPGYIGTLEEDSLCSLVRSRASAHHIGISDLLLASKLSRQEPKEICLIGMQPQSTSFSLDLTETVNKGLDDLAALAIAKLTAWGVECVLSAKTRD